MSFEQEKDAGITSNSHTAVGKFFQLLFVNTPKMRMQGMYLLSRQSLSFSSGT
jgi:hypothetical protein